MGVGGWGWGVLKTRFSLEDPSALFVSSVLLQQPTAQYNDKATLPD